MFTGTLSPIAPGETFQETLELSSEDDGVLVAKSFLDECAIEVKLFDERGGGELMTGSAACPADGILILSLPATSALKPGLPRLRVRMTRDGVTDDLLNAVLPIT